MIAAVLPVSATLAADPMDSIYPPTPAVNVTSGQCQLFILGSMASRANMTAMLPTRAESNQTETLANVGPCLVNIAAVTSAW